VFYSLAYIFGTIYAILKILKAWHSCVSGQHKSIIKSNM
jgi:hypothetical protein